MAEFKLLIEGYAREENGVLSASSSVSLLKDGGRNVLVDPGINRSLLLDKLEAERLTPAEIDFVVLTHYHPDHILLAGLFGKAAFLDDTTLFEGDREIDHKGIVPGTSLKIIAAPGHAKEHCVILAETDRGKIAVAGDVFWWRDAEEPDFDDRKALVDYPDPYVKDEAALRKSRRRILDWADYVVPGHGRMFRV